MIKKNINFFKLICFILSFILCITTLFSCTNKSIVYEYDSSTYLKDDTPFNTTARTILPSNDKLKNAQITYYEHNPNKNLRISVLYSEADFEIAKQELNILYEENIKEFISFYFDGILYNGYMFYVEKERYIMSFHICSDSNMISYTLAEDFAFEYYTTLQAFEITYGEHRITPIS